jgi:hypothetical protein
MDRDQAEHDARHCAKLTNPDRRERSETTGQEDAKNKDIGR